MKAMKSKPYEKERKRDIQHVFKKYDRSNKGYINLQDLREMTHTLNEPLDEEMMRLMIERASRTHGDKMYF
jgi:Ca2+-binding EF-hand superfamily protein